MMLILSLLCSLGWALQAGAAEELLETRVLLGEDCTLQCTARDKAGVRYRAVRWYKVLQSPSSELSGLVTRDLANGTTRWYTSVEREVELLDGSRDIVLPRVRCSDGGVYLCHLAAPVGEQNQDGRVRLTVTDCPSEKLLLTAEVVIASVVLMIALLIFLISYTCLRTVPRERSRVVEKQTFLDAPLKPLDKKDLMLIYTLGSKPSTKTRVCV